MAVVDHCASHAVPPFGEEAFVSVVPFLGLTFFDFLASTISPSPSSALGDGLFLLPASSFLSSLVGDVA